MAATTRRLTITAKQLADRAPIIQVVRHLRLRCECGGRAAATVTVDAGFDLWPRIYGVAVDGDPVTAMVKTTGSGYVNAERLTPPPGVRPYPGRTEGTVHFTMTCLSCGTKSAPVAVKGTHNPSKECNDVCQGATGPNCDCRCAGANHGRLAA
jgi:hypothetical protein